LNSETILLSAIIPIEVAHRLFNVHEKRKALNIDRVEELLSSIISLENIQLIDIDSRLVMDAIKLLKKYHSSGIGGRDSLILASMDRKQVTTILTHDKNLLGLNHLHRIDPVFDPPLKLKIGENFNPKEFK